MGAIRNKMTGEAVHFERGLTSLDDAPEQLRDADRYEFVAVRSRDAGHTAGWRAVLAGREKLAEVEAWYAAVFSQFMYTHQAPGESTHQKQFSMTREAIGEYMKAYNLLGAALNAGQVTLATRLSAISKGDNNENDLLFDVTLTPIDATVGEALKVFAKIGQLIARHDGRRIRYLKRIRSGDIDFTPGE